VKYILNNNANETNSVLRANHNNEQTLEIIRWQQRWHKRVG